MAATATVLAFVAACGGSPTTPAPSGAADSGTRTVTHAVGEVVIPTDPQRLFTLDEYSAMNVFAVGVEPVEPVEVFGSFGSEVSKVVLEDEVSPRRGVRVRATTADDADACSKL